MRLSAARGKVPGSKSGKAARSKSKAPVRPPSVVSGPHRGMGVKPAYLVWSLFFALAVCWFWSPVLARLLRQVLKSSENFW